MTESMHPDDMEEFSEMSELELDAMMDEMATSVTDEEGDGLF